jgi:selenoprotein W-related protein
LEEFEQEISDLLLIPSRGGVFEVEVDGTLVHSKKASGKHAEYDQVLKAIRELFR